ncbi:MAG: cytochrome b/b6 domain-containing protein [Chloroflexi bacterium]|nr:cytochrome b/b6 domain-containing protein [Chloroflexota bacterium]
MSAQTPKRYSPLWVTLHWVIALLIFITFYLGISTQDIPSTEKVGILRWHMPLGITVLLLMIVRFVVRWRTPHPEPATVGNALLDKIGEWTHYLLYIFAILMPLTGTLLSVTYNLAPVVFGGEGSLPRGMTSMVHGLIGPIFGLLILLHILAALYHQIIRRDNLLARMWYGK